MEREIYRELKKIKLKINDLELKVMKLENATETLVQWIERHDRMEELRSDSENDSPKDELEEFYEELSNAKDYVPDFL